MLRRLLPLVGAITLLPATPAAAQEDPASDAVMEPTMAAVMQGLFPAQPLTAEQEARLPAAQVLADRVVPDGIYAQVMDSTLTALMGPMGELITAGGMDATALALRLGVSAESLADLTEAERMEMTRLLDPAFQERGRVAMNAMMAPMADLVATVEPQLRTGIARAYATRFDAAELAAIEAFFATPTGTRFAAELLPVFSDPQVMSASMEILPQIMERMPDMMGAVATAMESLPPERGFSDLNPAERRRLADLAGTDVATLKNSMVPPPVVVPVP